MRVWFLTSIYAQCGCIVQKYVYVHSGVTDDAPWLQRRHLVWDFVDVVHNVHSVCEDLSRRNQLYQGHPENVLVDTHESEYSMQD